MNQIGTTANNGLLKTYYPDDRDATLEALKRKREKLTKTRLGVEEEPEEK